MGSRPVALSPIFRGQLYVYIAYLSMSSSHVSDAVACNAMSDCSVSAHVYIHTVCCVNWTSMCFARKAFARP